MLKKEKKTTFYIRVLVIWKLFSFTVFYSINFLEENDKRVIKFLIIRVIKINPTEKLGHEGKEIHKYHAPSRPINKDSWYCFLFGYLFDGFRR